MLVGWSCKQYPYNIIQNRIKMYIRLRYGIQVPSIILLYCIDRQTYGVPVQMGGLGVHAVNYRRAPVQVIRAADAISPYSTHVYTASVAVADAVHATTNHRMSSILRPQPPPAPRQSKQDGTRKKCFSPLGLNRIIYMKRLRYIQPTFR